MVADVDHLNIYGENLEEENQKKENPEKEPIASGIAQNGKWVERVEGEECVDEVSYLEKKNLAESTSSISQLKMNFEK